MKRAAMVALLFGLASPGASAVEVFPDRTSAVQWLATQTVDRLYTTPGLEDETIRIDCSRDPESMVVAEEFARELARRGYAPHLTERFPERASVALFVTVRAIGCEHELILHWRRPTGAPVSVRYARLDWLAAGSVPSNVLRATSPGFHASREAARRAAIAAAEAEIVDRVSDRVEVEWSWALTGVDPRNAVRKRLTKGDAPYRVTRTFYQQSSVAGRASYRAFLLVELAPDAANRLASEARGILVSTSRGRVARVVISIAALLMALTGYYWADGRTRGFLRGPLRVAFSVVSLGLVLAVWMV